MVLEHRAEHPSQWATIEPIADKIGCVPRTLYTWVKQHKVDACPQRFKITATYKQGSKQYSEPTTVDLQPIQLTSMPHDPVAEKIKKLVKAVEQINSELRQHRD